MPLTAAAPVLPGAIADALRADLVDGREPPGTAITETAVAVRFGVARPTARLAIDRLVADGLLRREAHQAARVPELTRDDISDVYANRSLVEAAAARALADEGVIPTEALAAHAELLQRIRGGRGYARVDADFHRALVAGQPSPRLTRMHHLLMGEVELCIGQVQAHHLIPADEVARQHQAILDAIAARDPEAAAGAVRHHVDGAREALLAHFDAVTR